MVQGFLRKRGTMKPFVLKKKTALRRIAAMAAAVIYSAVLSSCTNIEESVPEGYYDISTDVILSDTWTAPETISAFTEPETSAQTSSEAFSEAAAETSETSVPLSETGAETSSGSETSDVTEETSFSESTSEETSYSQEFVETTTAPQVTVVTIPTRPSETTSEASSETSASHSETEQAYYSPNSYYALNFSRQKAMWISYLEYERIMKNASEDDFKDSLSVYFDNIASLGCNTVYFQVRAHGDAYYRSSLFPKGDRLTGDYDPLAIAVKLAHDKGLSIHAWINPMRLMTDAQMKDVPDDYLIKQWYNSDTEKGTYIVNSAGRWYLNPAYGETVALICRGINEIVSGYAVDGIQIDDYFYPTTDGSFDKAAYEASGTSLSLDDWRRDTVTAMVKKMYSTVHSANPTAVFGISPQGNIASNEQTLYADVRRWVSEEGCCDYICPQIYYGFENSSLPFTQTVDAWRSIIKRADISLVIGLAAYKTGTSDKYAGSGADEWKNNTDILKRQRELTDLYNIGYAYFRYDSLFLPDPAVSAYASEELNNLKFS